MGLAVSTPLTQEDIQICEKAQVAWQTKLREKFEAKCDFSQLVDESDLEWHAPKNPFTNRWHKYMLFSKTTEELLKLFSLYGSYKQQGNSSRRHYNKVITYQNFAWEILFAFIIQSKFEGIEFEGIEHLRLEENYSLCEAAHEIILAKLYRKYSVPMLNVLDAFADGEQLANAYLVNIGMCRFRTEANHKNLRRKYSTLPMVLVLRELLYDFHLYDLFWNVQSFRELGNDYGRVFQSLNQRIDELNRMRGKQEYEKLPLETRTLNANGTEIVRDITDDVALDIWETIDSEFDILIEYLHGEYVSREFRSFIETRIAGKKRGYFLILLDELEAEIHGNSSRLEVLPRFLNLSKQRVHQLKKAFLMAWKRFVHTNMGGISNEI